MPLFLYIYSPSINWVLPLLQTLPFTPLFLLQQNLHWFSQLEHLYNMARFMFICFLFLILAVDHVSASSTGSTSGYPMLAEYNRKMLMALKRSSVEQLKRDGEVRGSKTTITESAQTKFNDAELRSVPAGPDPLHHNGGTPKMPKSSP